MATSRRARAGSASAPRARPPSPRRRRRARRPARAVRGGGVSEGRRYGDRVLYRRLLLEARPFWPHIGGLFLLELLATPIALLLPVPLVLVVDSVIGDDP